VAVAAQALGRGGVRDPDLLGEEVVAHRGGIGPYDRLGEKVARPARGVAVAAAGRVESAPHVGRGCPGPPRAGRLKVTTSRCS